MQNVAGKALSALSSRNPPSESPSSSAVAHGQLVEALHQNIDFIDKLIADDRVTYWVSPSSLQLAKTICADAIKTIELFQRINAGHIALIESQQAALTSNVTPPETPTEAGK